MNYTSDMVLGDVPSSTFDFEMEHIAAIVKNDITTVHTYSDTYNRAHSSMPPRTDTSCTSRPEHSHPKSQTDGQRKYSH